VKGGDTGPAIVPGHPEKSLLLQAVKYEDHDLQMPPEKSGGKMPAERIAELEAWIRIGAPDPRTNGPTAPAHNMAKAKEHWAFKPVVKPAIPTVKDSAWVKTPLDAFVLAKLEAKGLKPAPVADRRTLLRRVYFDLTGLPPSSEEMETFLADKAPDAFAKVIDRLLDSPHYGERWGRYWLDVARYADTRGYLAGGEERRFPYSHTYRDYVIHAFTDDKPYDQFIREQIAADRLVSGDDQSALAALGFLTLGRAGSQPDVIDDRIDVVSRGLMALTVGCARCHDHKFDPIPTADYYSLYGVFASSQEPPEEPLLNKVNGGPAYEEFLKKKAALDEKVKAKTEEVVNAFLDAERRKMGDYLLAAHDLKRAGDKPKLDMFAGERKLVTLILDRWRTVLDDPARQKDPVLAPWFAFAALPEKDFAPKAKELAARFAANADTANLINPLLAKAFAGASPASLKDVAAVYNTLSVQADDAWIAASAAAEKAKTSAPAALPDAAQESIRQFQYAKSPIDLPRPDLERLIRKNLNAKTVALRKELGALEWSDPGAPLRAMAMVDKAQPVKPYIFVRGNPGNGGPPVPRQFLEVLAGPDRKPFADGSGRLELAKSIASPQNPLTARVFVNRFWGWHFGSPLVRTPGDFGTRTEAPVQVAMLDWLAGQFMEDGWSIKKLHKQLLLSNTYQQSSDCDVKTENADPDNALLHRYNRHRLDFESMRDSLLAASGKIDLTVGGQPVEITKEPFSSRRTVYGFIDRLNLPSVFRTFDFANPDISSPQRFTTTVPQQALFMMNSPFVVAQAQALVHRPEVERSTTDADRLQALYEVLYQRAPQPDEIKDAQGFLKRLQARAAQPPIEPGWHYGFGWYDPLVNNTKDFRLFTSFVKGRRSPSATVPDKQFGFVSLSAEGGHPGPTPQLSTVLRWVSPLDGKVKITGTLSHTQKAGDGVHAVITSGRGGKLGEWIACNSKAPTEIASVDVKLGEAIDFIVDCRTTDTSDSYNWSPIVTFLGDYDFKLSKRSWEAQKDFNAGKKLTPLTAWETLAQAMLVSNEMMFIE
jgi:hypothetical protein